MPLKVGEIIRMIEADGWVTVRTKVLSGAQDEYEGGVRDEDVHNRGGHQGAVLVLKDPVTAVDRAGVRRAH